MWDSSNSTDSDIDILDVDAELKDDSLFALEDRTYDGAQNVIQQWKNISN